MVLKPSSYLRLKTLTPLIMVGLVMLFFSVGVADAATSLTQTLDQMVDVYKQQAGSWEGALRGYALQLFWLLAGIQFTWAAIRLAIKGADIADWLSELTSQILFIGFFLTLLLNSSAWATAIVNSFRAAGSAAGGVAVITPSNVLENGISIAIKVWSKLSIFNPGDSIILAIAAAIILICFALVTAFLIVSLVESYMVISAGVLFMGFGGSRWTHDYAIKIINYAVSVGAKLFVLQLLIGLGQRLTDSWVATFDASDNVSVMVIMGASIIFFSITKSIPEIIQGLINGSSIGTHAHLVGLAGAATGAVAGSIAGAVTGGTSHAIGGGYALAGAGRLASEQLTTSTSNSSTPPSQIRQAANFTGNTAKNLINAGLADIGGRLSGRRPFGTMGGRMGADMMQQARDLAAERNKPQPPTDANQNNGQSNTIRPE